jgi:ribonuclease inhibitor
MKKVVLDGKLIHSIKEVHTILSKEFDFGPYYSSNYDALWDRLTTDVERPVLIEWINSEISRQRLGNEFEKLISLFNRVVEYDIKNNLTNKFVFTLNS